MPSSLLWASGEPKKAKQELGSGPNQDHYSGGRDGLECHEVGLQILVVHRPRFPEPALFEAGMSPDHKDQGQVVGGVDTLFPPLFPCP